MIILLGSGDILKFTTLKTDHLYNNDIFGDYLFTLTSYVYHACIVFFGFIDRYPQAPNLLRSA
jgi:hypothetical protein